MQQATDFCASAITQSKLRMQKARRERFKEILNQRRGLVCLHDLVETSAKEVNNGIDSSNLTNPEETENEMTMDIDMGKTKKKKRQVSRGSRVS
jgi:hypothetical protein